MLTTTSPASSFDWNRPVPKDWQADLDTHFWHGEHLSRPTLSWLAGFPYAPVQRWVIYEVMPSSMVGAILEEERKAGIDISLVRSLWQALKGPDPRADGHWLIDKRVAGGRRWRSKSMVSRNQWDLHRQTGGLPLLAWIIEGERGGHSWQFGILERAFLLEAGTDPELLDQLAGAWPDPGSQSFATYDHRVREALTERDQLRRWVSGRSWTDRTRRTEAGLILDTETAGRQKQMQERMLRWMDHQIGEAVSDIPRKLLPQWSDFTKVDGPAADEDAAIQNLLEG